MDSSEHVYLADGAEYLNSQAFVLETSSDLLKALGGAASARSRGPTEYVTVIRT